MKTVVSSIVILVGLCGSAIGGFIFLDDRHAHDADVVLAAGQTSYLIIQTRIDLLQVSIDNLRARENRSQEEHQRIKELKAERDSLRRMLLQMQSN